MYVIDVIPLAFIPRNQDQILSYFHSHSITTGALVEIPLGSRIIKGIVLNSDSLKSRKLDIRKIASFQLKNIARVVSDEKVVFPWQIEIARFISLYYFAPLGISLKTVLPPFWGKKAYPLKDHQSKLATSIKSPKIEPELVISSSFTDHAKDYEEIIEKTIAQGRQILLIVPEYTFIEYFASYYQKFTPLIVSSRFNNKSYYKVWEDVRTAKSQLIIATRVGLFLPFTNLGLLIIDDEANEAYESDMSPRYNTPLLAQKVAEFYHCQVIINTSLPRIEIYDRFKNHFKNYDTPHNIELVDMIKEIRNANFSIFSQDLKGLIYETVEKKDKLILYIPRKGHANFVLCQTCGQSLKCSSCRAVLVLHKHPTESLVCHHCNSSIAKPKNCPSCQSYALKSFGVGIEKVVQDISRYINLQNISLPNIYQLDSDTIKPTEEAKLIESFKDNKPSILITTQSIFSYKYLLKTRFIGIINADTLINIPDFRAEETLLRQLITLALMCDQLYLQSYNPDNTVFQALVSHSVPTLLAEESANRRLLGYPPSLRLIKLTYRHKDYIKARHEARSMYEKLNTALQQSQLAIEISPAYPAFITKEKGLYIWHILLKVKETNISKRNRLLSYVPTAWLIDIDPKTTL